MFGRHPRLPVDLVFGLSTPNEPCEYSEYVQTLHDSLSQAYAQANQTSRNAKVCHVEGRQKLCDKWESRRYIVVKKQPSTPVYVVRSEDGERERVLHRNLLTQCMFLPVEQAGEVTGEEVESDTAEDEEMYNTEEVVETVLPWTTDGQVDGHTVMEEEDLVDGQMDQGEEEKTSARRNPQRTRSPPKKLSCESQILMSEDGRRKRERGWELWQRAKARRAAGLT